MAVPKISQVLQEAARAVAEDGCAALCHVVRTEGSTPGKVGWKLLVRRDGSAFGNLGGGAFEALVKVDAAQRLATFDRQPAAARGGDGGEVKRYYLTEDAVKGQATGMVCGGMAEVFLETMTAEPVFLACGGGPVGQALAAAAVLAGFETVVAEDRPAFRDPGLFPDGAEPVPVDAAWEGDFLAPWRRRDLYVAVVTRCWETDTAALAGVLRQAPPRLRYLGLMGSRRKVERVRREVEGRGHDLSAVDLRAPVGLPVGGDSPGEIAISILAEVLAVRHGRPLAERTAWNAGPRQEDPRSGAGRRGAGSAGADPGDTAPRDAGPGPSSPDDTGHRETGPRHTGPHDDGPRDNGPRRPAEGKSRDAGTVAADTEGTAPETGAPAGSGEARCGAAHEEDDVREVTPA